MAEDREKGLYIYDEIPFSVDVNELAERFHIDEDDDLRGELEELVADASSRARPKAMLRLIGVEHGEDGRVTAIGGQSCSSVVLDKNLRDADTAVAYVVTCGAELEGIDVHGDPLAGYWLDELRLRALRCAHGFIKPMLPRLLRSKKLAFMAPGSLPQWPISEQTTLFACLGDVEGTIGVRLTDSFLMRPLKSGSGLVCAAEKPFENCMVCRRFTCPGRRAPYDAKLAEEFGEIDGEDGAAPLP